VAEHDITCRELCELTTDYLEEVMPARMRTTFEQHVLVCDFCVGHLAQLRATRSILGSLPPVPAPAQTVRAVRDAFGAADA
jgi:hypothetical protein